MHYLGDILINAKKHLLISHCLEKILKQMYCVHIHANNWRSDNAWCTTERNGIKIPMLLEFTFIRKDMADDFKRTNTLRTDLDRPNIPSLPEVDIHYLWKQIH